MTTPGEHRVRKKGKVINQKNVRLIKFIALERLYEKVCMWRLERRYPSLLMITFTLDNNYPVIKLPNLKIKFLTL